MMNGNANPPIPGPLTHTCRVKGCPIYGKPQRVRKGSQYVPGEHFMAEHYTGGDPVPSRAAARQAAASKAGL